MKKKIGFDEAIEVIKIGEGGTDWVCKHCGHRNLLVVGFNDITSCANCKGLVMIKRR
jgi:DNA-directed RNA polymerase subunit RPC12/RpoP